MEWRSRRLAGAGGRGTEGDWSVPLQEGFYDQYIQKKEHQANRISISIMLLSQTTFLSRALGNLIPPL